MLWKTVRIYHENRINNCQVALKLFFTTTEQENERKTETRRNTSVDIEIVAYQAKPSQLTTRIRLSKTAKISTRLLHRQTPGRDEKARN